MEGLTAPLGLRLPIEAERWWGWHDGVPEKACAVAGDRELGGPGFQFLPLAEAVEHYRAGRETARRAAARLVDDEFADPDRWWNPAWFTIITAGHGVSVTVDCSVAEGDATPVRAVGGPMEPGAGSLGELVSL